MQENNISLNELKEYAKDISREGKMPVFVAVEGKAEGIIAIADILKDNASEVVEGLQRLGLEGKLSFNKELFKSCKFESCIHS